MSYFQHRLHTYEAMRTADEAELARRVELSRPFAGNPQALVKPVRCRVLMPFCVAGHPLAIGEEVTLQRSDAESLRALGKVQFAA
jgi:hypothetical protein